MKCTRGLLKNLWGANSYSMHDRCKLEFAPHRLRGQGNAPILPLLRRATRALAETTNFWARECPGLIPAEVSAIVHWAGVNPRRANELIDNIVSWRDVAMHRYAAPDPAAPVGSHAQLHFDRVSEFYLEHPWLGERVRLSYAEELALCRLLEYCGLVALPTPMSHL